MAACFSLHGVVLFDKGEIGCAFNLRVLRLYHPGQLKSAYRHVANELLPIHSMNARTHTCRQAQTEETQKRRSSARMEVKVIGSLSQHPSLAPVPFPEFAPVVFSSLCMKVPVHLRAIGLIRGLHVEHCISELTCPRRVEGIHAPRSLGRSS